MTLAWSSPPSLYHSPYGGNDNHTKLLIHADGSVFDASASSHAVNTHSSIVSSTVSKFGRGSLANLLGATPVLSVPNHNDFNFGSGDFCVEGFFRPENPDSYAILFGKRPAPNTVGPFLVAANYSETRIWLSNDGIYWNIVNQATVPPLTIGVFNHVALYRNGSKISIAINGNHHNLATSSATLFVDTSPLVFGGDITNPGLPINGYIDEIRVSKGVGRFPLANFAPPDRAYY